MIEIKIIAVPEGEAPLEIRQQWVGMTLLATGKTSPDFVGAVGVLSGKPESYPTGGYYIRTPVALQMLEQKSPEAAEWWRTNLANSVYLIFSCAVCEVVS